MLYSTDQKLAPRFINPAPFSKFYLEIDNDSPGQVGAWIGWQIVRSYMKNNDVSIEELLKTNAKEIFGQPDVDGGLVGGASLKADEFVQIIQALK